jgi:hypothetical protein
MNTRKEEKIERVERRLMSSQDLFSHRQGSDDGVSEHL